MGWATHDVNSLNPLLNTFPNIIEIHTPDVAGTKGSGKRFRRGLEESMKKEEKVTKPELKSYVFFQVLVMWFCTSLQGK
jgi:hypothetical protein